ncbi:6-methylsalicylic acid decarboxylase [Lachnellula occidentalis]|uniref:6-methylsalicylic acid decarboxylase n=1 Tax=Lachnellula occidentalis TaxID=215460 RepID=A0A8H8RYH2_9HELO|nr:6-methylsalicylic acid decarboxylase [Lachnellula occidentalis]
MASENKRLRIAITGGGLAGAALVNALIKYPHIEVHIYESAPEFSERGAAMGLAKNSQNALDEIGPSVKDALVRAGAVPMNSTRGAVASGPNAGKIIFDLVADVPPQGVHRAAFLKQLLAPVAREVMHNNKKLVKVEDAADGSIILFFQDGTKEFADLLVGADGVHGYVREHILGADHPALEPTFAGFWDCRALVPFSKAKEVLGEEYFKDNRRYIWSGDGGMFMHDVLDNGKTVQCVASKVTNEDWNPKEWKRDLDRDALENAFASWTNSPIVKNMIELLLQNPELQAFAQWDHHIDAPIYYRGRVCMIGDAAHAMTPYHGAGAGQAIEDVMILETLLGEVTEPSQLDAAVKAYDEVRRPRAQRVVQSSNSTGRIMCGKGPDVGLDVDKLRAALGPRWAFLHEFDQKEHKKRALASFRGI